MLKPGAQRSPLGMLGSYPRQLGLDCRRPLLRFQSARFCRLACRGLLLGTFCCLVSTFCCLFSTSCCLLGKFCCLFSTLCCLRGALCCLRGALCCLRGAPRFQQC